MKDRAGNVQAEKSVWESIGEAIVSFFKDLEYLFTACSKSAPDNATLSKPVQAFVQHAINDASNEHETIQVLDVAGNHPQPPQPLINEEEKEEVIQAVITDTNATKAAAKPSTNIRLKFPKRISPEAIVRARQEAWEDIYHGRATEAQHAALINYKLPLAAYVHEEPSGKGR